METYPMAMITEPGKIEFSEKRIPELKEYEVLIRSKFASICGSDLHLFKGRHPSVHLPSAVGHELSGEIISVGKKVTSKKIGDRVTVEPVIACGNCYYCLRGKYHLCEKVSFQYREGQGAFAPYFIASEERVFILPDSISFEEGALIEPLSVAMHAVKKSGIGIGNTSAVFGAGAIGLLVTMLVSRITQSMCFTVDVNKFRLQKALEIGASHIIDNSTEDTLERILNATNQLGVDFVFEAVGLEYTLVQALNVLRKGGSAIVLGIFEDQQPKIPVNLFIQKEITLSGSQGYNWDFQDALNILDFKNLSLKPLITHHFLLSDLQKAFDLLLTRGNQAIKVVIEL